MFFALALSGMFMPDDPLYWLGDLRPTLATMAAYVFLFGSVSFFLYRGRKPGHKTRAICFTVGIAMPIALAERAFAQDGMDFVSSTLLMLLHTWVLTSCLSLTVTAVWSSWERDEAGSTRSSRVP
ncbi:MAG TPA: hypothetical protein VEA36_02935 [Candidatus Paceibacterota bacterium]|nr:hypothetical protein [Candidatus Paceibacterota bacterium]